MGNNIRYSRQYLSELIFFELRTPPPFFFWLTTSFLNETKLTKVFFQKSACVFFNGETRVKTNKVTKNKTQRNKGNGAASDKQKINGKDGQTGPTSYRDVRTRLLEINGSWAPATFR